MAKETKKVEEITPEELMAYIEETEQEVQNEVDEKEGE